MSGCILSILPGENELKNKNCTCWQIVLPVSHAFLQVLWAEELGDFVLGCLFSDVCIDLKENTQLENCDFRFGSGSCSGL